MPPCESPTKLTTDVFATGRLLQEQLESLEDRCCVNQEKGSDLKEKRHELQEVLKLFEMIEENEKRATAELEDTLARVRARYTVQDSDSAVLLPSSVESGVAGDSADIKPPAGLEPQPSGPRLLSSPSWVSDSDASRPLCQREVLVDAGCATGENASMALPEAGAILANPEEGANPREEIVMPPASRRERSLSSLSALQRRVLQAMDITPPRDGAAPDVEPAAAGAWCHAYSGSSPPHG
ncbi:hypothetical protein A0H81_05156 [Grifola frondosa]|uniref:Uncharacterized protein n=1 Tax=Grifola frondosa TaxID=5627 RepID=A0A1C7MHJ8_GRIFR|nr:hypothetical protein A0H81_05156 [Grifola frondosa]